MKTLVIILSLISSLFGYSQTDSEIKEAILKKDKKFWDAYNTCQTNDMKEFLSEDVEFYHDNGGITLGADNLTNSIQKNLCSKPDFKVRREAINSTVTVDILDKNNVIYGVIVSGSHHFYITQNNEKEFKSGKAKFFHLWLLKEGNWKMTRILSYDHQAIN